MHQKTARPVKPVKVLHLTTGLGVGGAEISLAKLMEDMDSTHFPSLVVSLLTPGPVAERIERAGVQVVSLDLQKGRPTPRAFFRLIRIIRDYNPAIVQTWQYHADLTGLLAARVARKGLVVWGLRCSDMDFTQYRRLTALVVRCNTWLSGWPEAIVANSRHGLAVHEQYGYKARRTCVIHNGFDTDLFRPDPEARLTVRRELDLDRATPLVALPARFDPQKNHTGFLAAAGILHRRMPQVHFVLIGNGLDSTNAIITEHIRRHGIQNNVHLLGQRADMPRLFAAMDIVCSSSLFGEGLPNVTGEAMACGTLCVVTDVGDSALLVGDTGQVVPVRQPEALADAIEKILLLPPEQCRQQQQAARERIGKHFPLYRVAQQYAALYQELTGPC